MVYNGIVSLKYSIPLEDKSYNTVMCFWWGDPLSIFILRTCTT